MNVSMLIIGAFLVGVTVGPFVALIALLVITRKQEDE
jgi:hypothetical protein